MVVEIRMPACDDTKRKSDQRHLPNSKRATIALTTIGTVRAPAPIHDSHSDTERIGSWWPNSNSHRLSPCSRSLNHEVLDPTSSAHATPTVKTHAPTTARRGASLFCGSDRYVTDGKLAESVTSPVVLRFVPRLSLSFRQRSACDRHASLRTRRDRPSPARSRGPRPDPMHTTLRIFLR